MYFLFFIFVAFPSIYSSTDLVAVGTFTYLSYLYLNLIDEKLNYKNLIIISLLANLLQFIKISAISFF